MRDEIFYAPYVISREVQFNTYEIIKSLVDENSNDDNNGDNRAWQFR